MAAYDEKLISMNPYVRYVNLVPGDCLTYSVPWRILYDFEIVFIIEGELVVSEIDNSYTLEKYDFHLMPPNIKHKRYINDGKTVKYFNVHLDLFSDLQNLDLDVNDIYIRPCTLKLKEVDVIEKLVSKIQNGQNVNISRKLKIFDSDSMIKIFERLYEGYKNKSVLKQLILKSLILKMFYQILNQSEDKNASSEHQIAIEKFVSQIIDVDNSSDNYNANISQYGFSPQYFRRLFKTQYNISPKQYLILNKMEKAKNLIKDTNKNINEISLTMGYENVYYFSRLFKKHVGFAPKIYRENIKKLKIGEDGNENRRNK